MKLQATLAILVIEFLISPLLHGASEESEESIAPRDRDLPSLKRIAKAHAEYMVSAPRMRIISVESSHEMAIFLARESGLNDYSLYVNPDELTQDEDTRIVLPENGRINPTFLDKEILVSFSVPAKKTAGIFKVPLFWTKGLKRNGYWSSDSPYGEEGGYVYFFDEGIKWFSKAEFLVWNTSKPTVDYIEALPKGSLILETEDPTANKTREDNSE